MPFDYEEYERKCSTLSPEALQKEWENYTRHIAGGATSTVGSVLFAPFTAGASLVGLGLSAPRIHNARKKREIIEAHLQAHGTTHHTRKRDVVAPMAIAGTLGGLTLGLAGPGADLIAGEVVGKGVEYAVSHAALEVAGATLEHKHDEHKKVKDQLELAKKYSTVDGYPIDQKGTYLSPQIGMSLRKSKSETCLSSLSYGSLPGEKTPTKPPRPSQALYSLVPPKAENSPIIQSSSPTKPVNALQIPPEKDQNSETGSESGMKLPYFGLRDHDEAEQRSLGWDPIRGMYVPPEYLNSQHTESPSLAALSYADLKPGQHQPDELEDLMSQLLVENSTALGGTAAAQMPTVSVANGDSMASSNYRNKESGHSQQYYPPPPPSLPPNTESINHLSPSVNHTSGGPPFLTLEEQSPSLPPRPKSSIGSYSSPTHQPSRPEQQSYFPPPPPPQQTGRQQAAGTSAQTPQISFSQPQYTPIQQYNPQQYSPSPSPSPVRPAYQPAHVQFPQYQYYPPPPPSPHQIPPPPPRRPSPQPLQHHHSEAQSQQRYDSTSSISTVSSASTVMSQESSALAASTPLTSYSTNTLTPVLSYDPSIYEASPRLEKSNLDSSPKPAAGMYFPPPPAGDAGKVEKQGYFG